MTTPIQILHRRDTAANWTAANPVLGASELGYETDTGRFKFGDGATAWNSLAYFEAGSGDVVGPATATDNAIARFDQGTGDLIQNSLVTIDDSGSVNIPSGQSYNINGAAHAHTITDSVYLRAAEALSRGTNGAAYTAPIEASTNHEIYVALDFDKDTDEFAVWTLDLPTGWNAGTVTFLPKWTATGGSGTVCWSIRGVCIGDNVAIDTAFGTAVTSTDTLQNADRVHIGPETAAMTFAGTVAAGKWLVVEVSRDVSEDTLDQDARLLGLTMKYTRVI